MGEASFPCFTSVAFIVDPHGFDIIFPLTLSILSCVVGAIQVTWIGGSMAHVHHLQFGIVLMALILVLVIVIVQVYPN